MQRIIPLFLLTLFLSSSAQASQPWSMFDNRGESGTESAAAAEQGREIATYANEFESLHMVVGGHMLGCKGNVSIYQTGESVFTEAQAAEEFDKIIDCIRHGQQEIMDSYNAMQTKSSDVSAYMRPTLQIYMEAVMRVFSDLGPREQEGVRERGLRPMIAAMRRWRRGWSPMRRWCGTIYAGCPIEASLSGGELSGWPGAWGGGCPVRREPGRRTPGIGHRSGRPGAVHPARKFVNSGDSLLNSHRQ